jgi:hypothetical protein
MISVVLSAIGAPLPFAAWFDSDGNRREPRNGARISRAGSSAARVPEVSRPGASRWCGHEAGDRVAVTIIDETHSRSVDNKRGIASGWLPGELSERGRELAAGWDRATVLLISHWADRWALDCLLNGASLEDLIEAPFAWREGWAYTLPVPFRGPA